MGNVQSMLPTSPIETETNKSTSNDDMQLVKNSIENGYDPFRDGLLRYLGYTNEVGEAFRRHISRPLYLSSYAVATTYVCADAVHKAHRSLKKGESTPKALLNAGDAFVWQIFASVIIPGFVINRITYFTRRLVRLKRKKCICTASPMIRYSPVAVGLLAIPFIIHPIDTSVSWVMDNSLRKLYENQETDSSKGR